MAKRSGEWVYDELLSFLANPFFQIPVVTFMEANCIIFDPSVEDSQEYRKIHASYKDLVGQLLDGFMKDTKLTHETIIMALSDMNAKADLREIFQGLFEQVLSSDDFNIFVRLMIQKNIELQQQALLLIIQTQGELPGSLQEGPSEPSPPPPPPPPSKKDQSQGQQSEEEIMKAILEQSKREYEEEEKKKKSIAKNFEKEQKKKMEEKEKEKETLIAISQVEHRRLEGEKEKEKEKLDVAMQNLAINEVASSKPPPAPSKTPAKPVVQTDLKSAPSISVTSPTQPSLMASTSKAGVSSSEAAANWLKQAQNESTNTKGPSSAVSAAAAALSHLSPEELQKRQQYLKEQRDKLLEMKKKEREKQLLTAEKSQPQRPMSARAAKSALSKSSGSESSSKQLSPEEEKKLAMRKAIADRLKSEVLGQK